jgi:hypothetical protein
MSRDNKPKAHRHGTEAQSNSRALSGASTGLEVVCARRVMLAIQELAIRVGRNRTAKLHRFRQFHSDWGRRVPSTPNSAHGCSVHAPTLAASASAATIHFRTSPADAWLHRIDEWIAYANSVVEGVSRYPSRFGRGCCPD